MTNFKRPYLQIIFFFLFLPHIWLTLSLIVMIVICHQHYHLSICHRAHFYSDNVDIKVIYAVSFLAFVLFTHLTSIGKSRERYQFAVLAFSLDKLSHNLTDWMGLNMISFASIVTWLFLTKLTSFEVSLWQCQFLARSLSCCLFFTPFDVHLCKPAIIQAYH